MEGPYIVDRSEVPWSMPASATVIPGSAADKTAVVFKFRTRPEDEAQVRQVLQDIFEAMATEEFPTGHVFTYTVSQDAAERGLWWMFEVFSNGFLGLHAKGPLVRKAGGQLWDLAIPPFEKILLNPEWLGGCGTPISEIHSRSAAQ